jgi:hypothetical protein
MGTSHLSSKWSSGLWTRATPPGTQPERGLVVLEEQGLF